MPKNRICIFGDSFVYGKYELEIGGWAAMFGHFLYQIKHRLKAFELGIGGNTSESLLKRFETELVARAPELALVNIGLNDTAGATKTGAARVELKAFEKNLEKLWGIAKKHSAKMVFIGLARVDEDRTQPVCYDKTKFYSNKRIGEYNLVIKEFCSKNRLLFISMADLLEDQDLMPDGLHPNAQGHRKILERVKTYLIKEGII